MSIKPFIDERKIENRLRRRRCHERRLELAGARASWAGFPLCNGENQVEDSDCKVVKPSSAVRVNGVLMARAVRRRLLPLLAWHAMHAAGITPGERVTLAAWDEHTWSPNGTEDFAKGCSSPASTAAPSRN